MREINFETAPAKGQRETWRAEAWFVYYDDPDTGNTVEICRCGMADSPRNRADAQRIARDHNTALDLAAALRRIEDDPYTTCQCSEIARAALALVEGGEK